MHISIFKRVCLGRLAISRASGCSESGHWTAEQATVTQALGFYSDLQSLHSEDAITWSIFGPLAYSTPAVRAAFVRDLLTMIRVPSGPFSNANVWLWRRLPHPDNIVMGGPEVDLGVQTGDAFLLGEAKWPSRIGDAQGVKRDKDQFTLRKEFCSKYGGRILPAYRHFGVLGVSVEGGLISTSDDEESRRTGFSSPGGRGSLLLHVEVRAFECPVTTASPNLERLGFSGLTMACWHRFITSEPAVDPAESGAREMVRGLVETYVPERICLY